MKFTKKSIKIETFLFSREPNREVTKKTDLGVARANYFGVGELIGEANHEAAKGLVAVEATVVSSHALEGRVVGRTSGESGNPSSVGSHERKKTIKVCVESEEPLV
jgi:hypothetical protein